MAPLRVLELLMVLRRDLRALVAYSARTPVDIGPAASAEEIEEVAALERPEEDLRELYRGRFDRGQLCFTARIGGTLVAYNWLAFGVELDEDQIMRLRPDEVYCLDAYTAEPWRGQGIHTELLFRMLEHARSSGYRRAYTVVSVGNRKSWKTHRRLGWRFSGAGLYLSSVGGRRPRIFRLTRSIYPIAGLHPYDDPDPWARAEDR